MSDKKREISHWEKEECAKLKAALEEFNAGKSRKDSLTQGKIAEALDMSQGSVSSYLNGYNALNARFASYVASQIGIRIESFSERLAAEVGEMAKAVHAEPAKGNVIPADFSRQRTKSGFIVVPQYDIAASMGKGLARPEFDVVIDSIVASVEYLSRNVRYSAPDNLALITGYGDSMQPTFSDGDILLVDTGITEVKIDAVYVMALKDELYIKRMQRRADGTFLMISDNSAYPPIEVSSAELKRFQVLARVLLAWNAKRL
ncbi:TPA: LexA family transcriptional regulator [Pseudomonas aeruginosa]|nr:LexA family transcriptional regulator [Pseudomonas aeruginosa]